MNALHAKLAVIQQKLNAPKGQTNTFGGYKYRSCEDILMAVKPLLDALTLTISDDIVCVSDRVYVKATATLSDGENSITNTAFAREALTKKGMDESQITGATSSYARKYALNGLLLIDDNKDADTMDNRETVKPNGIKSTKDILPASSKSITHSVWDEMDAEVQQALQSIADEAIAIFNEEGAAPVLPFLNSQGLDTDEKVALFSRFDSKMRSALKKTQLAAQPNKDISGYSVDSARSLGIVPNAGSLP